MKMVRFLGALATLCLAAACASAPFGLTRYPSADRPETVQAYSDFMVARVAALSNDPENAARRYASVLGSAPDEAEVAERGVYSALLAGDRALAAGLAHRASADGAGLIQLTLAADAIERGRPRAAINALNKTELRGFNRMVAGHIEAWSLLGAGDAPAAVTRVRENLTGEPRLDNATMHMLGLIQIAARDDEGALATFDTLWASGARFAVGAQAYSELLAARGETARAAEVLEQFRAEVGYNAALSALSAEIARGAVNAPQRLSTRQGAALSFYLPASILMTQTKDDVAAVYFVLAAGLDPQLDPARIGWAQAVLRGNRPEEALAILKEVSATSAFYPAARGQMALILLRDDRADEALRLTEAALAASPDRGLRLQLADVYTALERHADAEAVISDVIARDTVEKREDWRVYFQRGAAREQQSKWDLAEADLKQALAIEPERAAVLNYLGYSWIDRGIHLEEGMDLIRQAVALAPQSGAIIDSLGWAHFRLGEYEAAVDQLERAVTLLPGDPVLNDHLGDAYWMAGRKKEAGFQWRRALKLDPDTDDRARIEKKLLEGLAPEAAAPAAP